MPDEMESRCMRRVGARAWLSLLVIPLLFLTAGMASLRSDLLAIGWIGSGLWHVLSGIFGWHGLGEWALFTGLVFLVGGITFHSLLPTTNQLLITVSTALVCVEAVLVALSAVSKSTE